MLHLHPHRQLQIISAIFVVSWIIGTFLIHYFERAQGWHYFDALYFTIITTATIGFGDLVPHSVAGKILTMIYAVFYVPLFLYVATLMYESRFRRLKAAEEQIDRQLHDVEADVDAIIKNTQPKPRRRIASK